MKTVLVAGGGITGLIAAWKLVQRQYTVKILESGLQCGGAIKTIKRDGYLFEAGPNTIQMDGQDLEALLDELGLMESLITSNKEAAKRFIVRNRQPKAIPASLLQGLTTDLWSISGRIRVLKDLFIPPYQGEQEESLADFVVRRLGREMLDYAINPFVGGVYAGKPEDLSVKYGFPKLYALEQNFGGSLLKGAAKLKKQRKREGTAFKTYLGSFPEGLQTLTDTLVEKLGNRIHYHSQINALDINENGKWDAQILLNGHPSLFQADAILLALPTRALARIKTNRGEDLPLRPLEAVPYPSVTSVGIGVRRDAIDHPLDGFGMLVPEKENMQTLGTLFSSTLFPGRAPDDHVCLTTFVGGTRQPGVARLPQKALLDTVQSDLSELIGLKGDPEVIQITRWPKAIPQYNVGYDRFLNEMDFFESEHAGCFIAGHTRDGIALPKCVRGGIKAAERINEYLCA